MVVGGRGGGERLSGELRLPQNPRSCGNAALARVELNVHEEGSVPSVLDLAP
jgi:hypothetical protein